MNVKSLLSQLARLDIRLRVEDGQIQVSGPKGSLTPALKKSLVAHKAELIELLSSAQEEKRDWPPPIRPQNSDLVPVMSLAQQRLWLLHQLEGPNHAYNLLFGLELEGRIEVGALIAALRSVVARHEPLRQAFGDEADPMAVRLRDSDQFEVRLADLRSTPENEAILAKSMAEEGAYGFDLKNDWLIRATLFLISDRKVILLVNLHHLVSDGWSLGIFARELVAFYRAQAAGKVPGLEPLPLRYSDYAAWQRALLEHPEGKSQLAFWLKHLAGAPRLLQLPTDHPRPVMQSFKGHRMPWQLSPLHVEALQKLCRSAKVTPFMVLEALFALLLQRYSGQAEVNMGVPLANRVTPELELLQGMFVNTVVLRHSFSHNLTFEDYLEQVRRRSLEAFANADIPFEHIIAELNPQRSLAYSPVFQTMFILQNQPFETVRLEDLKIRPLALPRTATKLDLTMSITSTEPVLEGTLEYNSDLFQSDTIARLIRHFGNLLIHAADQPSSKVSALGLLEPQERSELLQQWHPEATPVPQVPIHELFEQRVKASPNKIAISMGQGAARREMTYAELNQRANGLALEIIGMGVGPKTLTAIFLDRSIEMVIALLATLKAGSAYVPLDPEFPDKRLAMMFEDSQPKVVITSEALASRVPESRTCCVLENAPVQSFTNPQVAGPQNPEAYVIFTSGSTGRPKGVVIGHRPVVNFLNSMAKTPGLEAEDSLLAVTTLSFDIAVLEIFLPLTRGAHLEIAAKEDTIDGAALARLLEDSAITVMQATPATWKLLLASGWKGSPGLKILCGGEAFPSTLAERLLPRCKELWNMYGPTEATIWSSCFQVRDTDFTQPSMPSMPSMPLGQPIANTQFYVLDEHLEPVPNGVAGQLYIGGEGLAKGYHQQPELTGKAFIIDPFARKRPPSGLARLYATGDLVKRHSDGNLYFLGRMDHQVKRNGFRIELGDIEAALSRHPAVQEAAVVLNQDIEKDQLAAYLVPRDKTQFPEGSQPWREYLQGELQWYMIPSVFMVLDQLPLTPNHKLDRAALPKPTTQMARAPYQPPETPIERTLVKIWQAHLSKEKIGIRDNFFELGGHSLIAAKLVHNINQTLETQLPMRVLFRCPTIAECAAEIEAAGSQHPDQPGGSHSHAWPELLSRPEARDQPFPLTDVQFAYWIGRSGTVALGDVATHIYSEHDTRSLDLARCERAINQLIQRHDMLRATIQADGTQIVREEVPVYRIEVEDLRGMDHEAAQERLLAKRETLSHQVLPADRWPLFHIEATWHGDDRLRFHISLDALITDGWSMRLLSREFFETYANPDEMRERPSILFRDYVLAERALEEGEKFAAAKAYWGERVQHLPAGPQLVLAVDPGQLKNQRFERRTAILEKAHWTKLQARARAVGITPSALLLTVYATVLEAWSQSSHFSLNLTLFNRLPLHPEVNDLIGDFTSLLLLEADHREPLTFAERARRLQDQLWKDWEHRLFSGIRVLHEMAKARREATPSVPVVFTSMLGMASTPADLVKDHALDHVFSLTQTPQVWLDHQVSEHEGQLVYSWDAIAELFHPHVLDDMFSAYQSLLSRLAFEDGLWDQTWLDVLPPSQKLSRQRANATQAPVAAALLQDGFIHQARTAPERPAVIGYGRQLDYRTLLEEACQVAQVLRARGVKPQTFVAIVMEKGWEQVVAAYGVLLAGAIYLPVDAHWPESRQHDLLALTEVRHVLTQARLSHGLRWPEGVQALEIGSEPCLAAPKELPVIATQPTDLAYVIFTSGSSGKPKGVAIEHGAAVNTIEDVNRRFNIGPGDRVLALSAMHFDLSVYDVFGLLAAGGALVLPNPEHLKDPSQWAALMKRHQVTVWNTVPALMAMLAHHLKAHRSTIPNALRLTMMSGDWIPLDLPPLLRGLWPHLEVISLGGATEASIWSNYFRVAQVDPQWQSIPYGKPLGNQTFAVLNQRLEPCPDWVPGDLYIGGRGLAREYWGDPEKTAAAFITHPKTGERLYRTGDLGRYFPDGNLEFLGRKDAQVKIQGHRIELGEIESVLRDHPAIKQAVVAAKGKDRHNKRLIAYYILQPSAAAPPKRDFIEDPIERLAFKLAHHNLKNTEAFKEATPLGPMAPALREHYLTRQSFRDFKTEAVDRDALLNFMQTLSPLSWEDHGIPKYRYPSAGSLYPVQTYLFIKPGRVSGVRGGFYYFHPADRTLRNTSGHDQLAPGFFGAVNRNLGDQFAFALFLVGKLSAIAPMYGERSRDFCMLEAGHMGQLLMDQAPQFGLGLCPIGHIAFDQITAHLNVDATHFPAYTLVGGAIRPEQLQTLSSNQDSALLRQFADLAADQTHPEPAIPAGIQAAAGNASAAMEQEFIAHLRKRLPEYMIPSQFQIMTAMPLTANGKVDRNLLPEPTSEAVPLAQDVAPPPEAPMDLPQDHQIEIQIADIWKQHLELDAIGNTQNFFDLGGNSVLIVKIQNDINRLFDIDVSIVNMFRLPTIASLANHIRTLKSGLQPDPPSPVKKALPSQVRKSQDIAIIGFDVRFPGAPDAAAFWQNLTHGVESIRPFSQEELRQSGVDASRLSDPHFVNAGGAIDDPDLFDANFFNMRPREAEIMDPQQRLFMECVYKALENAGYASAAGRAKVGLFAGTGNNTYLIRNVLTHPGYGSSIDPFQVLLNNSADYFATRIAYKLNLRGPSMTVQTACSTSLVSVHLACQALIRQECGLAVAGGANVYVPPKTGYVYKEGLIFSADGHCRAFDEKASGTVFSSGLGAVILKPLEDAQRDGDAIHAVIKGSAINNDGSGKVGFTAPSIEGQLEVIQEALARSGLAGDRISYVETHGTGTVLGDPIEVEALRQGYGSSGKHSCALGSVKTNVGHLEAAAGIAGLIKTVLMLKHKHLPPSLNFESPNPKIDFENSAFFVNTHSKPWQAEGPRHAGVSSFGVGGTNAHVILSEAPPQEVTLTEYSHELLTFSAKSERALSQMKLDLAASLEAAPETHLAHVAYTLHVGRPHLAHCEYLVARDLKDAVSKLRGENPGQRRLCHGEEPLDAVFMFPGQGSQYPRMSFELYQSLPAFRNIFDDACAKAGPLMGLDPKDLLFNASDPDAAASTQIAQTQYAQPLLFLTEYSLAQLWMAWGIRPRAMIGHSLGEITAACMAGVMAFEDALKVVIERGRLMQSMKPGAMVSVAASERTIQEMMEGNLALAAVNSPNRCTVSGPNGDIEAFLAKCEARQITTRHLHTSHAFHSAMMDPMIDGFLAVLNTIGLQAPKIPFISGVTGTWIDPEQAVDPAYWATQLRATVQFEQGLACLLTQSKTAFLEVGPGQSLSKLLRQQTWKDSNPLVLQSLPANPSQLEDTAVIFNALGQMWLHQAPISWADFHRDQGRQRIPLPSYPFEKKRFWLESDPDSPARLLKPTSHGTSHTYLPAWRRLPSFATREPSDGAVAVFAGRGGFGKALSELLQQTGQRVYIVEEGAGFQQTGPHAYTIAMDVKSHYEQVFESLPEDEPLRAIHFLPGLETDETEPSRFSGFNHLLYLVQTLETLGHDSPLHLNLVTSGLWEVLGDEPLAPINALRLGPLRVGRFESANLHTRVIDIVPPDANSGKRTQVLAQLKAALAKPITQPYIEWALRGRHLWQRTIEPKALPEPVGHAPRIVEKGTYLITGGLRGIGLVLAGHLATQYQATLVLLTRSPFPAQETWSDWAPGSPPGDTIAKLKAMADAGASVAVMVGDVTDPKRMRDIVLTIRKSFGALNGIIHAAGLPGAGIMQLKTTGDAARVLAPKVEGARVLAEVTKDCDLDFTVYYSSVLGEFGGPGQVDYCAANAFLDAHAHQQTQLGRPTYAMGWDGWAETGMAHRARRGEPAPAWDKFQPVQLPFFSARTCQEGGATYYGSLDPQKDWVLSEHRVGGGLAVPGTAYLEMAVSAFRHRTGSDRLQLQDVFFLKPLTTTGQTPVSYQLVFTDAENGCAFEVRSTSHEGHWVQHAKGSVVPLTDEPPQHSDLVEDLFRERFQAYPLDEPRQGNHGKGLVEVGPRWHNASWIGFDGREGFATLTLAEAHTGDLADFTLHPALLDVATGFSTLNLSDQHLPFSYQKVRIYGPLPRHLTAFSRSRATGENLKEFDYILADPSGRGLVTIEGFGLIQIAAGGGAPANFRTDVAAPLPGLTNAQGLAAFDQILSQDLPQVAVSYRDIHQVLDEQLARSLQPQRHLGRQTIRHQRPELATEFSEPQNKTEKKLAEIWQDLLGLERVGIHDSFLDLGGDSLAATQLGNIVSSEFGENIPLTVFFESSTIAKLAEYIDAIQVASKHLSEPTEHQEMLEMGEL